MRLLTVRFGFAMLLIAVLSMKTAAQNLQGGLHFTFGMPQGEFKSKVGKNGYGIAGNFGYSPAAAPVMVGLELGFLVYGSESRREPFSSTIPDVTVDVNTTNNIAFGHFLLRLQPTSGVVRPYVDGLVGLNYLSTTTEIQNRGRGGEEVASSTNFDDVAFSYGGGGGIMFRVYESDASEDKGIEEVLIDIRGRYLLGGEAEYLKEGSIRRENGKVRYDVQKSKTDLASIQIGVAVRF